VARAALIKVKELLAGPAQ